MFCALHTTLHVVLGATSSAMYETTGDHIALGAAGTAWTLGIMFGTWAAMMGIECEVRRQSTSSVYREYESRRSRQSRFLVGPGGVSWRF